MWRGNLHKPPFGDTLNPQRSNEEERRQPPYCRPQESWDSPNSCDERCDTSSNYIYNQSINAMTSSLVTASNLVCEEEFLAFLGRE